MNEERLKKLMEWEAQKPDDPFLKFAIAQEYVSVQNDNEALKYFETLTDRFPDYLATYYQAGMLYERISDIPKAIAAYKKGMEVSKAANDMKTFGELNEALMLLEDE